MKEQQKECVNYILDTCFEPTTELIPEGAKPSVYIQYITPLYDIADIFRMIFDILKLEPVTHYSNHQYTLNPEVYDIVASRYTIKKTPKIEYVEMRKLMKILPQVEALKNKIERKEKLSSLGL